MNTNEDFDTPTTERQGIQVISRMAALLRALENRPDWAAAGISDTNLSE
jgi:hypothetical protein